MGVAPHYFYTINSYMLIYSANHARVFVACVYRRIVLRVKDCKVSSQVMSV